MTQKFLKSVLIYNKSTGVFTWKEWKLGRRRNLVAGSDPSSGYIQIKIGEKLLKAHRLAWLYVTGKFPREQIDHRNRIRSDNRWKNLREASHSQNRVNTTRKPGKLPRGVWKSWGTHFAANIYVDGKRIYLGRFASKNAASRAYRKASRKHYGQFSKSR